MVGPTPSWPRRSSTSASSPWPRPRSAWPRPALPSGPRRLTNVKRRHVRFAAVALVLPAIASCSSGGSSAKQSAASIPATATTAAGANAAARLATLLIADLPAGYIQQPDTVGDTGPSDLAKAARDDGKPDAAGALTADRFLAG